MPQDKIWEKIKPGLAFALASLIIALAWPYYLGYVTLAEVGFNWRGWRENQRWQQGIAILIIALPTLWFFALVAWLLGHSAGWFAALSVLYALFGIAAWVKAWASGRFSFFLAPND